MANYLIYPMKTMNITQDYTNNYSHAPHSSGSPKDYPWDDAGADSGREYFYCPCDKMKVLNIYGVGNGGTNTIWLESTSKVDFADGTQDYVTILVMHSNDDDLKKLSKGQVFTRGQKICREGTDGYATGNHFHLSVGKGKSVGNGWTENSKNAWVLTTTNGTYKPEQLFFVDKSFTTVKSNKNLKFKSKPEVTTVKETTTTKEVTAIEKKYTTGDYRVTADVLNVRTGPGTNYANKSFSQLTANAQAQVKEACGYAANGYVKGVECTISQVSGAWGKTPSGWICLDYCEKI